MSRYLTLAILLALALGGTAMAAYQVFGTSRAPAPAPTAAPAAGTIAAPSATPASPQQAARSFDQKVGAFEQAAGGGGRKPVELVLTQEEITSKVRQLTASRGGGEFQNVAVQLLDGEALITGDASVAGMTVPVQAVARLSASGGMLEVNVTSVKAGNLEAPEALRDQLMQAIQRAVGLNDIQKIDVGIEVQSVQVTTGQVRIAGTTR